MNFSDFPKHHAVLISHPHRNAYSARLWQDISALSPAHKLFDLTVLDIETARDIISFAQSPYSGERVGLISFHTATHPAQNALLKILEEPKENIRFVIVTSNKEQLLPTVLSRVYEIRSNDQEVSSKDAQEFLETPYTVRMKLPFVVELLSRVDEEGRKDREGVRAFLFSLVEVLREKKVESKFVVETLECASYASDPSASGKALLEYVSLLLPVVK